MSKAWNLGLAQHCQEHGGQDLTGSYKACWPISLESQRGKAGIFQRILWNDLRRNKKELGILCSFKGMHANYTV